MSQGDKAGTSYWDKNWSNVSFPKPFDHKNATLDNYVNLELHRYFQKILGDKKDFSVLEIGCAHSIWLVYFYQYFNAKVYGLDYSTIGVEQARAFLKYYNVPGKIFCVDLFSPPPELLRKFDLVVSFGVVEHFLDTAACLKSCAAFVKPGGLLLTLIPNIPSIIGFIQKYVDRAVYDVHVPITKKKLQIAHEQANLSLQECDYFMSINLNVVNSGKFSSGFLNTLLRYSLSIPSKMVWILEKCGLRIPKNRFTSPYLIAVANIPLSC